MQAMLQMQKIDVAKLAAGVRRQMTVQSNKYGAPPRRLWRSAGAIFAGFLAVAVLSLATDQVLHMLNVYPPWGEPMHDPKLNLLALAYRIVYTIVGGYRHGAAGAPSARHARGDPRNHRDCAGGGRHHRHG